MKLFVTVATSRPARSLLALVTMAAGFLGWPMAVRAATPAGVTLSDQCTADQIIDRWLEAIGGDEAWRALQTADYEGSVQFPTWQRAGSLRLSATAGGMYRFEFELPELGTLVQAYDGGICWQKNEQLGFGYLGAAEHRLNQFVADFRAPLQVYSRYPVRRRLADVTLDGRGLQVVELSSEPTWTEKWFFDPVTGYRVRMELPGVAGAVRVVEYDDFRVADGAPVREAFRVTRSEGNRQVVISLRSVCFNTKMPEERFLASSADTAAEREIGRLLLVNAQFSGSDRVGTIQTRVTEEEVEVTSSGARIKSRTYQKRPNLMVSEQDVPGMGKVWQGFDGQVGWSWSEVEGFRRMQGAELLQALNRADLDGPLKTAAGAPLRRLLGEREVNGRRLVGVALAGIQGSAGSVYFDADTCELVEMDATVQAGANGRLEVTAEFSDYRDVDGIRIPFKTVMTNPAMRMVSIVKSVRHNVPVDDELFKPRRE